MTNGIIEAENVFNEQNDDSFTIQVKITQVIDTEFIFSYQTGRHPLTSNTSTLPPTYPQRLQITHPKNVFQFYVRN